MTRSRHLTVTDQTDQDVTTYADEYGISWGAAANVLIRLGLTAPEHHRRRPSRVVEAVSLPAEHWGISASGPGAPMTGGGDDAAVTSGEPS